MIHSLVTFFFMVQSYNPYSEVLFNLLIVFLVVLDMAHPLLSILTDKSEITFKSGEGVCLTPIINNGKITEVVVNSPGNGYNSPPDLVVRSLDNKGDYAILVPIIKNGQIDAVVIQKTGLGYTLEKLLLMYLAGRGSRVQTNVSMEC